MKKSVMVVAVVVTCWGTAGMAQVFNPMRPFVGMSVPDKRVCLESVEGSDFGKFAAKIIAHVTANCPHQIEASFSSLKKGDSSRVLTGGDLSVSINGKNVPVGTGHAAVKTSNVPTLPGGVDVPLELKVALKEPGQCPAGDYKGTLMLTVIGVR